jgi:hypothetical protein
MPREVRSYARCLKPEKGESRMQPAGTTIEEEEEDEDEEEEAVQA